MLIFIMPWVIEYYDEKVRETIDRWPLGVRAFYAKITERMKLFGPNLGMPFTRAFFCTMREKRIIVLHAFTKRTARTPEREIRIAHKRLKELSRETQEES
jgi:hypothetical protein